MPNRDDPYRMAMALARSRMGQLDLETARTIDRALREFADNIDAALADMPRRIGADALRRSERIVRDAADEMAAAMTRAVAIGRDVSYAETLAIWENAALQAVDSPEIRGAILGALRTPNIIMLGAFESIGGAGTWRSVLGGAGSRAGQEAAAIIRLGLVEDIGADELGRRLRRYVVGSEGFRDLFEEVPTLSGRVAKIDLRRVPAPVRQAARQMRYNAERLAFSEIHNARHEAEVQHAIHDPFIKAMRWRLSPNRGINFKPPDQCDVLASANFYGLGTGVFPVKKVPGPPHPFDRCELEPVTRGTRAMNDPKPNPGIVLNPRNAPIPGGADLSPARRRSIRKYTTRSLRDGRLAARASGNPAIQQALERRYRNAVARVQGGGGVPGFMPPQPK